VYQWNTLAGHGPLGSGGGPARNSCSTSARLRWTCCPYFESSDKAAESAARGQGRLVSWFLFRPVPKGQRCRIRGSRLFLGCTGNVPDGAGRVTKAKVGVFGMVFGGWFLTLPLSMWPFRRGAWEQEGDWDQAVLTALLGKLKEIFRASRSQPVGGVIEKINPIVRGWVKYFAIGHSSRCFSHIRDWVKKKIRRHLARACQRRGFGWKRWSREWLYGTLGLFSEYRVSYGQSISAVAPAWIGLINLVVNCAGARSAGNPHATCDVAGAGNQFTVRIVRHSQRKRGATDRPDLRSNGVSPRPYQPASNTQAESPAGALTMPS
jgi:hypothetical protein